MLEPILGQELRLVTMFGAVAVAVWVSGWFPATLAALTGYAAIEFIFVTMRGDSAVSGQDLVGFAGYSISCGTIILLAEFMHSANARMLDESRARRHAEFTLAQEKELLATTLASIGDAVIVTDVSGCVSSLNSEAERLTGWVGAEAVGRPLVSIFQIVNERSRQPADNPVDQVLRIGSVVALANHTILISKDGREWPIHDSAAPIRHGDGPILGVVLVFRDISADYQTQQAQARLAAIIEYSGDAIATKNLDGIIQTWNRSAERLFGYGASEIVGQPMTVLIPPDRLTEEQEILDRLRQGVTVERIETVRIAKDGRHVAVAVSVSPIKNASGIVTGASTLMHDISAQREMERQLLKDARHQAQLFEFVAHLNNVRSRDELFAAALDHVFGALRPDRAAIVLFDESECTQVVACRGLSADYQCRMTGHGPWDREPLNADAITIEDIADSALGNPMRDELTTEGIQALAVVPLIFQGNLIGDLMTYHDERHRFEPDEVRLAQTMAHQLASAIERIRGENALRAAKVNAEQASRAKDDFLATLSHELRTPLTPVLMTASDMAQDMELSDTIRQSAQMIVRNISLEARLIDDLLDLTRIEKGKLSLRSELCDVHAALGFALATVRDDAEQKHIAIDVKLEAERFHVAGDSARLQQIFWNVLGNAVKYTQANGHIRVRSSTEGNSAEPRVRIQIRDDGHGFNSEMADRIFEPFQQEASGVAESTSGLGLGLAIARMLVTAHRGEIHATSDGNGEGATFTIELPITASAPTEGAQTDQRHVGPVRPQSQIALRLLLVEDHKSTSDVLCRLLTKGGHNVVLATSVAEARAAAAASKFDAVVSDLGLPDGTGFELMEELSARYGLSGIAVSGFGMEEDVRRSQAAGFVAHLTKPIEVEDLRAALARLSPQSSVIEG